MIIYVVSAKGSALIGNYRFCGYAKIQVPGRHTDVNFYSEENNPE